MCAICQSIEGRDTLTSLRKIGEAMKETKNKKLQEHLLTVADNLAIEPEDETPEDPALALEWERSHRGDQS